MIRERYAIPLASPGAILREEKRAGTELGLAADALTSQGRLVPDQMVLQLVERWLEKIGDAFVCDGFPRTLGQAHGLESLLKRRGTPLEVVLALDADLATLQARVTHRMVCQSCGRTFSLGLHIPEATSPCPHCGASLVRRGDDTLETLDIRMREYQEKTAPLIDYYERLGLLRRINATETPEKTFSAITQILEAE